MHVDGASLEEAEEAEAHRRCPDNRQGSHSLDEGTDAVWINEESFEHDAHEHAEFQNGRGNNSEYDNSYEREPLAADRGRG